MMTLLNLKHLYMGISWHSGISSWLGQKECKSGVELLFSRKIHLFSFAAIGINKERENRNILYWQKDLKNDVKRKTRWYTRNKAILEIKLGPGCEITSGHWTFLLTRHSCQMHVFGPCETLKSGKSYPVVWSKSRNIRKISKYRCLDILISFGGVLVLLLLF